MYINEYLIRRPIVAVISVRKSDAGFVPVLICLMATRVYVMKNFGGRNISFRRVAFKRAIVGVCSALVSCICT